MATSIYLGHVIVALGLTLAGVLAGYRLHDIQRERAWKKKLRELGAQMWEVKLNWVPDQTPDASTVEKAVDKLRTIEQAARNARWN